MEEWGNICKDPSSLNTFIQALGVQGCEIEEIFNLETLEDSKQVHGLILVYSWNPVPIKDTIYHDSDFCFMNLLDPKLSATMGILTILLNSDIELSLQLAELKRLIMPLVPRLKSVALHNSAFIRKAHNSISGGSKDNEFFACYLPSKGKVLEVDGLRNGPSSIGESAEDEWLDRAKHFLHEKISKFSEHGVKYTILALSKNKQEISKNSLKAIEKQVSAIKKKLGTATEEYDSEYFEGLPDDKNILNSELTNKEEVRMHHEQILKNEKHRIANWSKESKRRKHNYAPFILALLKKLDEKGVLNQLIDQSINKKSNNL